MEVMLATWPWYLVKDTNKNKDYRNTEQKNLRSDDYDDLLQTTENRSASMTPKESIHST
jgi:hypothetical protein